ncbi:MAG: transglycosylase SLT domain-containing protein [Dehalococcoidia bacterium]|nr:transglycosylase SLT domain-containing protein [Dehalococcoidia bacterium]
MPVLLLFLAGAIGSLVKDILEDNKLKLPKITDDNFYLGFLGGVVTGGLAGYFVDGNPTTAFLAGYAGTGVVGSLLARKNGANVPATGITESLIRKIALKESVDPDLAVRVAKCESNLDYKAEHLNKDGSKDRGLFQINNKYHPDVSDEAAFNPIPATQFFCKAFKAGNLSWWDATRKCWEK